MKPLIYRFMLTVQERMPLITATSSFAFLAVMILLGGART